MMLADTTNAGKTRLNKKSAAAGRLIWIVIAVISMVTMIIGVPVYRQTLMQVCTVENAQPGDCPYAQLTPTDLQTLESNELTLEFYASTVTYSYLLSSVVAISIAAVIFWKRSDEAMALLVSLTLLLSGSGEFSLSAFEMFPENLALLGDLLGFAQATLLILFLLIFPTGVFVPRWTRWIIFAFMIMAIGIFSPGLAEFMQFSIIGGIIWLGSLGTAIFSQVYRYFRVSTPTTRQQTKLIVFSLATGFLAILPFMILRPNPGSWGFFLEIFMNSQFSSVLSIAFLISILQYRLWDINIVINRSIVYTLVTAVLGAVFAVGFFGIRALLQATLGGDQPLYPAILSAMIVAAIFTPTSRSLRRFVDRRFYGIDLDYTDAAKQEAALRKLMAQEEPVTSFGKYKALGLIGRGGMGEVYKSEDPDTGRAVAIKTLYVRSEGDREELVKRFHREAQAIAGLGHENIVKLIDYGEQKDIPYMVMEYIDGESLSHLIPTGSGLPLDETLQILAGVASALDYAHRQGLVHRDIKPSNVIVEAGPPLRAVLMDFGIARMVSAMTALTGTGGMVGTLDYISPEQIQGAHQVDGRADIYSLGVMAYQMVTGELPFKHKNPGALIMAHLSTPAPDARELVKDLPRGAAKAIQQAMAKDAGDRFGTAGEFMQSVRTK